jgi:hypothetical protein
LIVDHAQFRALPGKPRNCANGPSPFTRKSSSLSILGAVIGSAVVRHLLDRTGAYVVNIDKLT